MTYKYDWMSSFDKDIMLDFNWFLRKINQRVCIQLGYVDEEYKPINRFGLNDYGLGENVEYFHPTITLDDRMKHIAMYITTADTSQFNIFANTLISHFYGARGVHQIVSGKLTDPAAIVDFDKLAEGDTEYLTFLQENIAYAKKCKLPIWGSTELHTSLQAASRNYCRVKYDNPNREFHTSDIMEWVASFRDNGIFQGLLESEHMEDAYKTLIKLPGVGDYYGFHAAASTSVIPFMKYQHDQRFVAPGPGARYLINKVWPDAPKKLYDESIYFMRENQNEIGLTQDVLFHPSAYNFTIGENNIFHEPQNGLKYYGTEVLSCQFAVYLRIRDNKAACERRKVSRLKFVTNSLES